MCILPMYICRVFLLQKVREKSLFFFFSDRKRLLITKGSKIKMSELKLLTYIISKVCLSICPSITISYKPLQDKQETLILFLKNLKSPSTAVSVGDFNILTFV